MPQIPCGGVDLRSVLVHLVNPIALLSIHASTIMHHLIRLDAFTF